VVVIIYFVILIARGHTVEEQSTIYIILSLVAF